MSSLSETAVADRAQDASAPLAMAPQNSFAVICSWTLAAWLLMVPIRSQVMGYGWYWLASPLELGWPVLAGSYMDLLYLLGLGAMFLVLAKLSPGRVARRVLLGAHAVACVLSLLFALANIDIVAMVGHPLTYSWLYYSGFLRSYDAQQALAAGLTWKVIVGAGLCITSLVALAWAFRRLAHWLDGFARWRRWAIPAGIALLAAYLGSSAYSMREFFQPSIQNPVIALAGSMLQSSDNRLFSIATTASTRDYKAIAAQPGAPATNPPAVRNVLVIVLESVGAQYLPAYGSDRPVTPELDSYRSQSKLYRNIYAHAPATNKSLVSLLCSMYPWPTYRFLTQEHPDAGVISLSDVLHERGYRTAFISSADLRFGNAEGFLAKHSFDTVLDHRTVGGVGFTSNEPGHLDGTSDSAIARSLTKWIEADAGRPFFAMLWTNQTHYPYFVQAQSQPDGPNRDFRTELMDRYYKAISETDAAVGQLLGDLKRLHLDESTLVVVVGDHGEAFGQHGRFGHGNTVRELKGNTGGFGHGTALYEENIHVPLMLINPKLFSGEDDSTVGGLVDIGPTVLDLLHLPMADGWQGRSLARPIDRERVYFAAPWSGAVFGFRHGDRKYLFDAIANSYQVFDLSQDPAEMTDISGQCSAQELQDAYQHLAAWVQYQEQLVQDAARKQPVPR